MNTDDRALADLIARRDAAILEIRRMVATMPRRNHHGAIDDSCNAISAALDRLEAFHAKPLDRAAILVGARAWWKAKMPSDFISAEIKGDGRVVVYWQDSDESGKYTLPVDFLAALQSPPPVVSGEAARRYKALREIGAAPGSSQHLEDGLAMVGENLDNWLDDLIMHGSPPADEYDARYCSKNTSKSA